MQKTRSRLVSLRLSLIAMLLMPASVIAAEGFDCLIEPNMVVDVSSAVEGVVERFHVERSDFVEEGQLLLELESGNAAVLNLTNAVSIASNNCLKKAWFLPLKWTRPRPR
jgi:hypothetical protein